MKNNHLKYACVSTLYIWLGLFILLPLVLIFIVSLLSNDSVALYSRPFTISHYQALFSSQFLRLLLRSTVIAASTTVTCLLIAYPFSYLLAKTQWRKFWFLLVLVPFWTSSLVRSYALIALLKNKGLLNLLLMKLGLIHTPLNILYTNTAVMIGLSYNLLPFMILPLYSHFERFDNTLVDAARDLGASNGYCLRTIILPLSFPAIGNGVLLTFFPAMTLFYIATILGGAKSLLLGNYIESQFILSSNWPQGAATSVLLTSLMLALMGVFHWRKSKS